MSLRFFFLLLLIAALVAIPLSAADWQALGPDGGDVRALAYDPHNPDRIFLGTSAGELFLSTDGGSNWSRFVHLGQGDDYVLDNIVIDSTDSNLMYVGAWSVVNTGGDLFRSRDGGRTWQMLPGGHDKSIRALAQAASDRNVIVFGALDGVFRSRDGGDTFERISPEGSAEIRNVESIAVDPKNPDIIYAGTWHLPWKTGDGGKNWHNIKNGVIDDSDVFSIIIDPVEPSVVYASACSGIYKSENAGELFHKAQGIPFSARRTRVLQQDPVNRNVVYAGTTEGLWKTSDSGHTWQHMSGSNLIINDVMIDPRRPSRVLLATDRSGVLASNDAGHAFISSNRGFAHRQVSAVVVDRSDPRTMYAGVINDKEFGGIFLSRDGGASWSQINRGILGHDIFAMAQADDGTVVAGTAHGIFRWDHKTSAWEPINTIVREEPLPPLRHTAKSRKSKTPDKPRFKLVKSELNARVARLEFTPLKWYAVTAAGLFTSTDKGRQWMGGPVLGHVNFVNLAVSGQTLLVCTPKSLLVSSDGGLNWSEAALPSYVTALYAPAVAPDAIWLATREGAIRSNDNGKTWEHVLAGLPARHLMDIRYDEQGKRLLATAIGFEDLFESTDGGNHWSAVKTGYALRHLVVARGRLLATTSFDGVVAERAEQSASSVAASTQ